MKVALDFDGCLSHTMKRWTALFNSEYPDFMFTLRDVSEWAFYEKLGMQTEQAFAIFDNCWRDWEKLEPMEQDLDQKTRMLFNLANGEFDIVTSVNEEYIPHVEKWLRHHNCTFRNVIHSDDKHELNYDVYIDDSPKNALDIFNAGKVVLLINQPWNRDVSNRSDETGKIVRVYNLYHCIDIINGLETKKYKFINATECIKSF